MNDDPVLALMRDIERLRNYARWTEGELHRLEHELVIADLTEANVMGDVLTEAREEHGVAQLMRADDTPQSPGWSGDGD